MGTGNMGKNTSERKVDVWNGEVRANVVVAGDGPPLLYLHGPVGLRWDSFLDVLATHYTVYAPEHPGTADGDPDAIRAFDELADLILYYDEILLALGLVQPVIVGHSFGALVAAEFAAHYPTKVAKLVLISPFGLWRDDAPVARYQMMTREEMARLAFAHPDGPVAQQVLPSYRAAFIETEGLGDDPEVIKAEVLRSTWALACTGKFTWPIPESGLGRRLHRIEARTLLVWGEKDGIVPPIYAEEFRGRIARADVALIADAAHLPQLEQLDETSQVILEFLES